MGARRAPAVLPTLVLMTDDERLADPLAAARALPRGSLVILRARQAAHRAKLARSLSRIACEKRLYLSIANDPVLAAEVGAHGLHLSESRAHEAAHWRALKPRWLITAAAHSPRTAAQVRWADAVLMSPVFETASHHGRSSLGPMRLRVMARALAVPLYALGGINELSARRLMGARLAGLAGIGALAT